MPPANASQLFSPVQQQSQPDFQCAVYRQKAALLSTVYTDNQSAAIVVAIEQVQVKSKISA